jgi:hypothetical protein
VFGMILISPGDALILMIITGVVVASIMIRSRKINK